jgi:putative ATP-dependent endonuclease of OLD family
MKLVGFTVRNYRSIIEAYKLVLDNYTVLVGPNNEGKSNLLKGVVLSLNLLTRGQVRTGLRRGPIRYYRSSVAFDYDWERDFPLSLQTQSPTGRSEFTLEFELSADDLAAFRRQVQFNLASNLKVKLQFGHEDTGFEAMMQGPGKKALNTHRAEIAQFIRDRISAQYVSAIRPSEMAFEIINAMIERELQVLQNDAGYLDLLLQLRQKRQLILDSLASKLKSTIGDFVSGINTVTISPEEERSGVMRSGFRLLVDDGACTDLGMKGDGIISLATIAIIRHVSQESLESKSLILSIEEPESHLHPRSVHGLRRVLKEISRQHQVIITTHSPILVEREIVRQNILVQSGHASRAKKIEDIRDALGIQLSDNLSAAYLVLLVEGEEDRDLLNVWLAGLSERIAESLQHRLLMIDHLAGATNLGYKASFYKQNVCNIHAYLDDDDNGRGAITEAKGRNMIEDADYNLASRRRMANSEIEDLILLESYAGKVQERYGVDLNQALFRGGDAKWSDRARAVFRAAGKIWDRGTKMQLKRIVVDAAVAGGLSSLNTHHRGSIDSLLRCLESKLQRRTV